jgi:hypothetical protein
MARASRGAVVVLWEAPRLSRWWCCGGGGLWLRTGPCAGEGRSAVGRKSSPVDGGHDGDALAASISLLRASWRGTALSLQGGSQGENLVLLDVRRRRLGAVTFWKASCSGAPPLVAEHVGDAAGGVLGSSCCLGAEGPWVLEDWSCCACCGGDLGDGGVEDMLSL